MAKMFYTMEETKASLGRNEEEIKQLAREGRLREFRDGPRLMFKADQVDNLKSELTGSRPPRVRSSLTGCVYSSICISCCSRRNAAAPGVRGSQLSITRPSTRSSDAVGSARKISPRASQRVGER